MSGWVRGCSPERCVSLCVQTIVTYNWRTRSAGDKYSNHSKGVQRVVYSSRHRALFSASRDSTIRQWRGGSFKEVQSFRGHTLAVTGLLLEVAPTGASTLISGARDYSLRTWSVETGAQLTLTTLPGNVVTQMRWIAPFPMGMDGNNFAGGSILATQVQPSIIGAASASSFVGSANGADEPSPQPSGGAQADAGTARVGAGFDAHCFLQCGEDAAAGVRVWDMRSMQVVAQFGTAQGAGGFPVVTTDAMSDPDDSNTIVSVTGARGVPSDVMSSSPVDSEASRVGPAEVRVWDRRVCTSNVALFDYHANATHQPLLAIPAHDDAIHSLAFLPAPRNHSANGPRASYIATASKDRSQSHTMHTRRFLLLRSAPLSLSCLHSARV